VSLKGKEILIIDDDTEYQFFMNKILANIGITIVQALSYDEAIEKLNQSVPHLVITDIKLGDDKSGIDIQRYLKDHPKFKKIPVFVVSTDANRQTIFQSLALGASEYMIKPAISVILVQKLRRIFMDYESPEVIFLDEDGDYKNEFQIAFENSFEVELETDINLRAINELSCILQGPLKFPKGTVIEFENELINNMGGEGLGYRSIENSRATGAGSFSTRFSLIGIDEKTAQKIRTMRVTKS
jgi:two-component system chemotaxis response regulator CheY